MPSNTSWIPNEDPQTLFSERCWLQGAIVSAIAYGITIPLYFLSFILLVREQNRVDLKKRLPLLIYIGASFLINTLYMVTLAAFTQMAFIDDRNYPGGPSAFEKDMFSIPIDLIGNAAFVVTNWLSDALVVWRFKVIYQMCRVPIWIIMSFPCLMLAGSVALGIMCLIQDSVTNPYVTNSVNFTLPYGIVTVALNITLTIAIVPRLMSFRHSIVSVMGRNYGSHYISLIAIMIESAALTSSVSITFLVLFGIGSTVSQVFLQFLNQIQTISALLIVFRVAQGKGWTEGTAAHMMATRGSESLELANMHFATPGASLTLTHSGGEAKGTSGEFQDSLHPSNNSPMSRDVV